MTQSGVAKKEQRRRKLAGSAAGLALLLGAGQAHAQTTVAAAAVPNQTPNSAMISLILQLVKQGSMSQQNGTILIQQALGNASEAEALANAQQAIRAAQAGPAKTAPAAAEKALLAPVATTVTDEQLAKARKLADSMVQARVDEAAPPAPPAARAEAPAPRAVAQAAPISAPAPKAARAPMPAQPRPVAMTKSASQAPVAPPSAPVDFTTEESALPLPPLGGTPQPGSMKAIYAQDVAPMARTAAYMPPAATGSSRSSVRPMRQAEPAPAAIPAPPPSAPEAPQAPPPAPPAQASSPAAPPPPTMRVSYVPESVRKQIADEVRQQVMAQAKAEGWAAPGDASPDWVRRITLSGDFRGRSQSNLYAKGNQTNPNDGLFDYAAINATPGGADLANPQNLTYINVTQNRFNRLNFRARLGVTADISKAVEVGFRLASGDDKSPISTNQILAGGLGKRDIWLDRAYLTVRPTSWSTVNLGRFANPFWSSELLFDDDLNFDGVSAEVRSGSLLPGGLTLAARWGAFPLDFGSNNAPDTSTLKSKYPTKWLLSGQLEADFHPSDDVMVRLAGAYHYFTHIQGRRSQECIVNGVNIKNLTSAGAVANNPIECSSDWSRAFYPRYGNTLFFIRDLRPLDLLGFEHEPQYLGLTYNYHVLDINAQVGGRINDRGLNATLSGNFVYNLGYKKSDECRYGNVISPLTNTSGLGHVCGGTDVVQSGNKGWLFNLAVGYDRPRKWGEWRLEGSYRYLQTDAVLDSLTDSDFHLGGTNAKGYTVKGSIGLFDGLRFGARWLSANEITGRPLAIDVLQVDLEAEF